jgi:proteasome lid subunit RPN8/RPN11
MVNTIRVPKRLLETLDAYILANSRLEHGGLLFGTPTEFVTFLPVPNVSSSPSSSYSMPQGWQAWADVFGAVVGCQDVAHVHTHPNHSIPSAKDLESARWWHDRHPYTVLIAPNTEGNSTTWWVLDKSFEVQELILTDEDLDQASLLLARRFGMANLGQVLMESSGRLLSEGGVARALLGSEDVRLLYVALLARNGTIKNKGDIQAASPLPRERTKRALDVLEKAGLVRNDWRGHGVTSIFARKLS